MPQLTACTYCPRPARTATLHRTGTPRTNVYSDPETGPDKDRSHVQVVRWCLIDHRPQR